jgi:hypothetical protein
MITIADAWMSRAGQITSSEVGDCVAALAALVIDSAPAGDWNEGSAAGDRATDPSLPELNPFRPRFKWLGITYLGVAPNENK